MNDVSALMTWEGRSFAYAAADVFFVPATDVLVELDAVRFSWAHVRTLSHGARERFFFADMFSARGFWSRT